MDQLLAALPGLRESAPTLSTEEREVLRGNPSPPSKLLRKSKGKVIAQCAQYGSQDFEFLNHRSQDRRF
jgi:hypothetical protein